MATLLSDTFTDTNGTALTSHTMDVGGGWTAGTGTFQVQSNAAKKTASSGIHDGVWADAGQADVSLSVDITWQALGDRSLGAALRVTDGTNRWEAYYYAGTDKIQLDEVTTGSNTTRASASAVGIASGNTYSLTASTSGTSLSVSLNGKTASYTSSSYQTNTKFGLLDYNDTVSSFDNFLVTGAAAGGATAHLLACLGVGG